jgi:hypothetical protein
VTEEDHKRLAEIEARHAACEKHGPGCAQGRILSLHEDRGWLLAALRESEAERRVLAADQCHHGYAGDYGDHRCRYQDELLRLRLELKSAPPQGRGAAQGPGKG